MAINCFFYGVGSSPGRAGGWRRCCVPIWTGIKGVCNASAEVNNSSSEVVGDAARGELGNDSKGFPLQCRPICWISSTETNPPGPSIFGFDMRSFKRSYREGLYPVYPTKLSRLCLEPALIENLSRRTQKKLRDPHSPTISGKTILASFSSRLSCACVPTIFSSRSWDKAAFFTVLTTRMPALKKAKTAQM